MGAPVSMPITLRWRTDADRAAITRLSAEAFGEYAPSAGEGTARMTERLLTLVACRGAELVGFAAIEPIQPFVMALQALAVVEWERGRGVGHRLLVAAEKVALRRGARRMTLHTAEANLAAFSLFARNGYRIERRLPRYYRGVFDACQMTKALGGASR